MAVAAEVLHALQEASPPAGVPTADVPDLASMHAWSLRLVDRGTRRRRGVLRLLR